MTKEQAEKLGLTISSDTDLLYAESGIDWIKQHTTYEFPETFEDVPASVRLFLSKYREVMSKDNGVASESIEGLSISYNSTGSADLLMEYARTLLGAWLKSGVTFVPDIRRWV